MQVQMAQFVKIFDKISDHYIGADIYPPQYVRKDIHAPHGTSLLTLYHRRRGKTKMTFT